MAVLKDGNFVLPKIRIVQDRGFENCLLGKRGRIPNRRRTMAAVRNTRRKSILKRRAASLGNVVIQIIVRNPNS